MKINLGIGVLLATAVTVTTAGPLRLGKNGPVVQRDGPMANVRPEIFRPFENRESIAALDRGRRIASSKFNSMKTRVETFLTDTSVETENATEDSDDVELPAAQNLELKKRSKLFEHMLVNLAARQAVDVTVTTTTTTKVTAAAEQGRTVTATVTATETIGTGSGGESKGNGTEGVVGENPAGGVASPTTSSETEATQGPEPEGSAAPTTAASVGETPQNEQAPTTTTAASEGSTASTTTTANEERASATSNAASSNSAPAPRQTAAGGISEFQNAEGISVPLEILGENIPKPESNSMSGLPLTPDPNGPVPTTAGKDLPAPTLAPDAPSGGTLLQPEPLPGQGQAPPTPSDQASPVDSAPIGKQTPPADGTLTQSQAPGSEPTSKSQAPTETQIPTENTEPDSESTATPDNTEQVAAGPSGDAGQTDRTQQTTMESSTVSQLGPDDIIELLNSAPPKRMSKREEMQSWTEVRDKIAMSRRKQSRGATGGFARRLQRRRDVF